MLSFIFTSVNIVIDFRGIFCKFFDFKVRFCVLLLYSPICGAGQRYI